MRFSREAGTPSLLQVVLLLAEMVRRIVEDESQLAAEECSSRSTVYDGDSIGTTVADA